MEACVPPRGAAALAAGLAAMGILVLAACDPGTGDGLAEAARGEQVATSEELAPLGSASDSVTWAEDVAPLLYRECVKCHRPEGPAPFSFFTYEAAASRAEKISRVTRQRFMPPWLPEPEHGAFEGERRLSEEEIALLQRWAAAGAPRGDPGRAPSPPEYAGGWQLGEPDMVLEMEQPYTLAAGAREEFRNFFLPIPVERTRYVRAVELRPGNAKVVHHAVMMVDSTRSSRRLAAQDSAPGFDGMHARSAARSPGGFLLGWTPGRVPAANPEGLSWRVEPGTDFVLQLHLRPRDRPDTVRARVGLHFTDRPPERNPLVLRLGSRTLDIPAGEEAYAVTDAYELPVDVQALGIYPHAHYLGDTIRVWAELPSGERRPLLRIDDWNFNWQDAYRYRAPVSLPAGTVLRGRVTYDNSADNPQNPHEPPERVVYGPRSTDEMCELWIQVLPEDDSARTALQRDFARKQIRSRIAGWRFALEVDSLNAFANYNLGSVFQQQGDLERAVRHYRRAIRSEPDYVQAHYNLGLALESRGDLEGAERHYRRATEIDPGHADAHNNLGNVLRQSGRADAALGAYRAAVETDPDHALARNNLANLLRGRGRLAEAVRHYERALQLDPDYAEAHFNLGVTRMLQGRVADGLAHYREVRRLRPEWPEPYVSSAWVLATHPDSSVRDSGAALRLAREASRLTGGRHPMVLDVLAAAQASAGDFDAAVATAETALETARAAGTAELARRIRLHLERYRSGEPFREPVRPLSGGR